MNFAIQHLSFYVIQTEESGSDGTRQAKHYQTLNEMEYESSALKDFLDSEFVRIIKRKAEINPGTENAPTKIGRFIVEPGHDLTSNPNFNLLHRMRMAANKQQFQEAGDDLLQLYMDTSAVRGGAFIAVSAKLPRYFDDPFVFVLKCDFESKIARISDEQSLISRVEMAISARSIKSIQYPHMPEEGMLEEWECKIHQASHARYFEDFLKFISYEKSKPELVHDHVVEVIHSEVERRYSDSGSVEEKKQVEERIEGWAASEKRELQEEWPHERVMEVTSHIVEEQPELELKFKLDQTFVKGAMSDYGESIHIARMNGRYVVLLEGDSFSFDKRVSPIEMLQPEDIEDILRRLRERN